MASKERFFSLLIENDSIHESFFAFKDQLHALANTEDSHLCLQFIEKFISGIRQQLGQLDRALVTQGSSYPTTLAVDKLDQRLKEYVHSQQKTFRHKMNAQLSELKQNIEEKQLYRTLFSGNLVQAQVGSRLGLFSFSSINITFFLLQEGCHSSPREHTG